jgi:hypothetical protein
VDELKQQIPLLEYLQAHDWQPARPLSRGRWLGLCPLHSDHKPSFLVDPGKSLFYCYGCGRGGDVIRFVELYRQVKFPQALALLHQLRGGAVIGRDEPDYRRSYGEDCFNLPTSRRTVISHCYHCRPSRVATFRHPHIPHAVHQHYKSYASRGVLPERRFSGQCTSRQYVKLLRLVSLIAVEGMKTGRLGFGGWMRMALRATAFRSYVAAGGFRENARAGYSMPRRKLWIR